MPSAAIKSGMLNVKQMDLLMCMYIYCLYRHIAHYKTLIENLVLCLNIYICLEYRADIYIYFFQLFQIFLLTSVSNYNPYWWHTRSIRWLIGRFSTTKSWYKSNSFWIGCVQHAPAGFCSSKSKPPAHVFCNFFYTFSCRPQAKPHAKHAIRGLMNKINNEN